MHNSSSWKHAIVEMRQRRVIASMCRKTFIRCRILALRLGIFYAFVNFSIRIRYHFSVGVNLLGSKPFQTMALVYPHRYPLANTGAGHRIRFVESSLLKRAPDELVDTITLLPHPDVGYYNLMSRRHRRNMRLIAEHFEVDGFVWYLPFSKHAYEAFRPVDLMLLDGEPNMPFCFCFANEDWSQNGGGSGQGTGLKTSYGDGHEIKDRFTHLSRFFHHKNYMQLQGMPVIMIHQTQMEESSEAELFTLIRIWNAEARKSGLKGIKFMRYSGPSGDTVKLKDLEEVVLFRPAPTTGEVFDTKNYELGTREHPGLIFSWLNHPISQTAERVSAEQHTVMYAQSSYYSFLKCAREVFKRVADQTEQRIVVLAAWNNWNEQSVFEPSEQNGYVPLIAIRAATLETLSVPFEGRVIHVTHIGGGTERYARDLSQLFPRYEHLFASHENEVDEILRRPWNLQQERLILHVHSVFVNGGIGRKVLSIAKQVHHVNGRVVLTIHDFQWVTPSDPNRITPDEPTASDLVFAREVFLAADVVIFPSNFVKAEYSRILGTTSLHNVHVVPHPDYGVDRQATWVPKIQDHISICFLGEFSLRKGAALLIKVMETLEKDRVSFKVSVRGFVAPDAVSIQNHLEETYGVEFKGQYDETFIVSELRESNIHVLALLSAVNETYCYALTQALNTGIAILHTGFGAVGERLEGYKRAFHITDRIKLQTTLAQMVQYLRAHEGSKSAPILSSRFLQPNLWYMENYPLYKK